MATFEFRANPREYWALELQGSDNVQFNGPLMQQAYSAMAECAESSGCMESGQLKVNEQCVETYERTLSSNGLGMRVKPAEGRSYRPPAQPSSNDTGGRWM
jgi:hypothetical protein